MGMSFWGLAIPIQRCVKTTSLLLMGSVLTNVLNAMQICVHWFGTTYLLPGKPRLTVKTLPFCQMAQQLIPSKVRLARQRLSLAIPDTQPASSPADTVASRHTTSLIYKSFGTCALLLMTRNSAARATQNRSVNGWLTRCNSNNLRGSQRNELPPLHDFDVIKQTSCFAVYRV